MRRGGFKQRVLWVSLLGICFFSSCSSVPKVVSYHLLEPLEMTETEPLSTPKIECLVVGPVSLVNYLDHARVVVRTGPNTLIYDEYNRWAEPLSQGITQVVTSGLKRLGVANEVLPFPWKKQGACGGVQLTLEVRRFDVDTFNKARFEVGWSLKGAGMKRPISGVEVLVEDVVEGASAADKTRALSELLSRFCESFLEKVRDL
ncbi:MAG: PqiC family protein [Desulfobacterales bacterium]|nr:PqiC family protein [Desulfobacterales bacterium]